jgi:ribosomal protein S18 acetylase RimI-like enzyme
VTAIDVREARPSDAPRLTELIVELGHPITEPDVRRNLETLSVCGLLPLVAEHDGAVIGMCGLSAMTTVHRDAPVGRISVMVVAEAWRGRGVGVQLVAEAERRLVTHDCRIVEVTSNQRRERAHGFYEGLGYERTSFRFMKKLT